MKCAVSWGLLCLSRHEIKFIIFTNEMHVIDLIENHSSVHVSLKKKCFDVLLFNYNIITGLLSGYVCWISLLRPCHFKLAFYLSPLFCAMPTSQNNRSIEPNPRHIYIFFNKPFTLGCRLRHNMKKISSDSSQR